MGEKKEVAEDKAGAGSWRIRASGRTRAARHPRMAGACPEDGRWRWRRVSRRGRAGEGEREADGWAQARKINGSS